MRGKRLLYNTVAGLIKEIILLLNGLILPKLIISHYGSATNGLISSISQYLSVIALLQSGVGGVVRSALYRPLANQDDTSISAIINATNKLMHKIATLFAVLVGVLAILYPFLVKDEFNWLFTATLVVILSISTIAQYYFGMTYQLLLTADQKGYIYTLTNGLLILVNLLFSVILIRLGASIHLTKLMSSICFAGTPIILNLYVNKYYKINKQVAPNDEAINQRWSAMGHQLANYIRASSPMLILTIFVSMSDVSVYSVYHLVFAGGISLLIGVFFAGMDATFGDMVAKNEQSVLNDRFRIIEFLLYHVCCTLFVCAFVLMPGFVAVYTRGINDANYQNSLLLVLMMLSELLYCIRMPYYSLINAAGCYKKTRNAAYIDSLMTVVLSFVFVPLIGVAGVSASALGAALLRTTHTIVYTSKNVLHRNFIPLLKSIFVGIICFIIPAVLVRPLAIAEPTSFWMWIGNSVVITFIVVLVNILFAVMFERKDFVNCIRIFKKMLIRKG